MKRMFAKILLMAFIVTTFVGAFDVAKAIKIAPTEEAVHFYNWIGKTIEMTCTVGYLQGQGIKKHEVKAIVKSGQRAIASAKHYSKHDEIVFVAATVSFDGQTFRIDKKKKAGDFKLIKISYDGNLILTFE